MSKEFKRTDWMRHLKLGKKRRNVKWRRAKGVHSKIRRKRTGYPRKPEVGYKKPASSAGLIKGKIPVLVHNIKELSILNAKNIAILARVGAKKKLELIKKAEEMKIQILNMGGAK
jgi:large subunit ribosomal protein L32e